MKNYLLIALAIGVAISFFVGLQQGKAIGKAQAENEHNAAIVAMEKELKAAREKSRTEIAKLETKLKDIRRSSDAKIKKLLQQNKELQRWWNEKVPDSATDFIYSDADGL